MTYSAGVYGETITDLYTLIIHILRYNFLCLHSDQTLVFCRCVLFTEFGSVVGLSQSLMVLCQSLQLVVLTKIPYYKVTEMEVHKLLVSHAVTTENHLF